MKSSRRDFLKTAGLVTAAAALGGVSACGSKPGRRPNIILFLIDDLGWKDAGYLGSGYYETPRIDELSRRGMVFTNAYANAPNCAPSRASLLTGQYTPRHRIFTVGSSARGDPALRRLIPVPNTTTLDPRFITLPEILHREGYISGHFGKWHLGDAPDSGPGQQGFDVNIGGNRRGHPASYFSPYGNKDLEDGPPGENLTDRLTEEAVKFIRDNRNTPFFLYLPYYAVHTPLQAKPELVSHYTEKPGQGGHEHPVYAAMIENLDANIGRILDTLGELDLTGDTIIIFFSDNGGYGPATSMAPLRGSKGMLYEGGIRVPLSISWSGRIQAGTVSDVPVIGTDIFPTVLDLIGSAPPPNLALDGTSLRPVLLNRGSLAERPLFWHFPAYLEAYDKTQTWRTTPAGAVRLGEWKLIEFFEGGRLELFNLKDDIGEARNLADREIEKTREMWILLQDWRRRVDAPVPAAQNPEYAGTRK